MYVELTLSFLHYFLNGSVAMTESKYNFQSTKAKAFYSIYLHLTISCISRRERASLFNLL